MVFSGNANLKLASDIARELNVSMGKAVVGRFSDGEVMVEVMENVRGRDVYVIQSTCAPAADNFMELMVMIDAFKRASASRVTAIIPYFGYARQDRRPRSARVPITAKVAASMISNVGTDRVVTIDLHADQIQGFFDCPVDNVYASPLTLADIWQKQSGHDIVVVSPDVGGVLRARAVAKRLDADLAIIDKRREAPNQAKAMAVIGEVTDKVAVILDDMTDTAGTLTEAAEAVKKAGAREVHACCAHPVLSGPAIDRIANSVLKSLVVTDTIPLAENALACDKINVLTISQLVGEAIIRSFRGDSVTSLFV